MIAVLLICALVSRVLDHRNYYRASVKEWTLVSPFLHRDFRLAIHCSQCRCLADRAVPGTLSPPDREKPGFHRAPRSYWRFSPPGGALFGPGTGFSALFAPALRRTCPPDRRGDCSWIAEVVRRLTSSHFLACLFGFVLL